MPVSCQPLQTWCFRKLINDFENFPPESLALLPLRFRYELIQKLPVADVCQLEQSSFVEGLDMEKVWETHCLQRKGYLPTGITAVSGNKDVYFSGVCKILLDRDDYRASYGGRTKRVSCRTRILKLLFCCSCFGTGDLFEHQPNKLLVPSRYRSYFAKLKPPLFMYFSDLQLIALVLQMSRYYYPKSLHCNFYNLFLRWEQTKPNCSLFEDYLRDVCNLHLSYTRNDLLESTILALRPLLIGDKGSHRQLKTFEIIHDRSGDIREETSCCTISNVTASEISRILIANQTSLHTIKLTSGSIPHHLCHCLSSFFRHPHLRLIHLSATLRLGSLQEILYAFLTTPRSSIDSSEVCLHIEDFSLKRAFQDMSGFKRHLLCLRPPTNNHCKSLVLSFSHVELPHPLITWLQERVVLRLKKLELSVEIANCFWNHQRMEVEEFSVVRTNKACHLEQLETLGCFDDVLGNKYLKRFRFSVGSTTWELQSEIVAWNLARGIHRQAEVGNLEELDLFYDPLGYMPEISEAIFSLPQIENLTLVITFKNFDESYLAMLKRSWREKAGGKQLKKLIVSGPWVVFPVVAEQTLEGIVTRELVLTRSCE